MRESLKETYIKYLNHVQDIHEISMKPRNASDDLSLIYNKRHLILKCVENAEKSESFNDLLRATKSNFDQLTKVDEDRVNSLKTVLRRSGCYKEVLINGKGLDLEIQFRKFCSTYEKKDEIVRYLAPIEYFGFNKEILECGSFQIRQFTKNELIDILGNDVNEIFYPYAAINLEKIHGYWFIYCETKIPRKYSPRGKIRIFGLENFSYTNFPTPIQNAILRMMLYRWHDHMFSYFHIPFVLKVSDDLQNEPFHSPILDDLELGIEAYWENDRGDMEEVFLENEPLRYVSFSESEAENFEAKIQSIDKIFSTMGQSGDTLTYIERSLGMLARAYFSEDWEQMIWNMTSIEALLGDRGGELTDKIAKRLSIIIGKDKNEKKMIKRRFKELYNVRSDLVHGNSIDKQVRMDLCGDYKGDAYEYARKTASWYVTFLSSIAERLPKEDGIIQFPKREIILKLIDMDKSEKQQMKAIFELLPDTFPNNND